LGFERVQHGGADAEFVHGWEGFAASVAGQVRAEDGSIFWEEGD
jgi:hypothetical protein